MTTTDHKLFTEGRRDNDLFHVANCVIKGGMQENEARELLEFLAQRVCSPPFALKEANEKVLSALKRAERRERNYAEEVRDFVLTTNGHFTTTECHNRLQVTTREGKKAVVMALLRLKEEGITERYGEKDGCYRRIENECQEIDFLHAKDQTIPLKWPFGIERYFLTLPKNIIVIAGEPDAGKTAFLLNLTQLNQTRHRIHYFSSEMGPIEMRARLSKFDLSLDKWNFTPKERSSNFSDVIEPDAVNVIDFLEVHDEFYRIGGMIKEIFDKLRSGTAVIAIQKNRGTDYGLGGMRGLEKARLYLAMELGKIKIVKAKNWASEMNPNGMECSFKLVQGCKFQTVIDWHKV